ncbi:DUF799 family lipoprotein [bacterium]|nr:DUF799 family lipoprotein [bacterium]
MNKNFTLIKILFFSISIFLIVGCSTPKKHLMIDTYPKMYEESPLVILTLPPINDSSDAEAKELVATAITKPLAEKGYYVISSEIMNEIFKNEGLYDSETINDNSLNQFKKFFGVNAILYTRIIHWEKVFYGINGFILISLEYTLKSAETGEVLWTYKTSKKHETSSGGKKSSLISTVISAGVDTAMSDHLPVLQQLNRDIFKNMPAGTYNKMFGKDQKFEITPGKVLLKPKDKD